MFKHIVVDAKKIANQARCLARAKEAQRWILQLSRPLADIIDMINENITALNKHYQFLEGFNLTEEEIEANLFVPKIHLQVHELKRPVTVCTSAQCCEFYSENNKKQHYYKQKCHDPCFLNNIPADIIGSSELMYCAAMNAQYYCKKCSCHFSKHMHVLYLTRKIEERLPQSTILENLPNTVSSDGIRETHRLLLEKLRENEEEYRREGENIVKIMAKFSRYLKQQGLSYENDAYEKYLLYLIGRETKYGPDADRALIKHYKSMLNDYKNEKVSLEASLTLKSTDVTPDEIFACVDKLFQLSFSGKQLKELHDVQMKCTTSKEKDKSSTSLSPSDKNLKKAKSMEN